LGGVSTLTVVVTLTQLVQLVPSAVIITVYVPEETPGPIMKVADPAAMVPGVVKIHGVGEVTRPAVVEVIVHVVERLSNPDPVMLTLVPAGPS